MYLPKGSFPNYLTHIATIQGRVKQGCLTWSGITLWWGNIASAFVCIQFIPLKWNMYNSVNHTRLLFTLCLYTADRQLFHLSVLVAADLIPSELLSENYNHTITTHHNHTTTTCPFTIKSYSVYSILYQLYCTTLYDVNSYKCMLQLHSWWHFIPF